jgi:hypothetical protein
MMLLLVELKVANGTSTGLNWIYRLGLITTDAARVLLRLLLA